MTLDTAHSKEIYQGNGTATVFPFAFKVWDTAQVLVTRSMPGQAGETDVTAQSTITLTENGGTVTYLHVGAPLPSGSTLAITRKMPFTQGVDLVSGSQFDPQVIEDALDQATAERQQTLEMMQRAVILPATSSETPQDVLADVFAARDRVELAESNVQQWLNDVGKEVGNNSYVTATETTTARTLADRFADIINVKDFGVVGDGITDDTVALAEAFVWLSAGDRALSFPQGCEALSQRPHFITGNNIAIYGESGAKILHNNDSDPCIILGTDTDSINNCTIRGLSINQRLPAIDLWNAGPSPYLSTVKRDISAGICIRNATSVHIDSCHFYNLQMGISAHGRVGIGTHVWHYIKNITISNCISHYCTYLCVVDAVDGITIDTCATDKYLLVGKDGNGELKRPHLFYATSMGGPAAKNITCINNRCPDLDEGAALIFKNADNVVVNTLIAQGTKAIAAYVVRGLTISNVIFNLYDQPSVNSFPAGIDLRSCKNVTVNNFISNTTAVGNRCYAIRAQEYRSNGINGESIYGDNINISNVVSVSKANTTAENSPIVEILGQRNFHLKNFTIIHTGEFPSAAIIVDGTVGDPVNEPSKNIFISDIAMFTDGVSNNHNRILYNRGNATNVSIDINTAKINFPFVRGTSGSSISGEVNAIVNGLFDRQWLLDCRVPSTSGSSLTAPLLNLGLQTESIGFYRAAASTLGCVCGGVETWRASGGAFVSSVQFRPLNDNALTLGGSSYRWSTVYAGTGNINTSDAREKQQINEITNDVLDAWANVSLRTFLFNDAVERKGEAARLHTGLIAQQIIEAFKSRGLDATRYGLLCYDEWSDEHENVELEKEDGSTTIERKLICASGSRYGVRYEEALVVEAAYHRRRSMLLEERIKSIEERLRLI